MFMRKILKYILLAAACFSGPSLPAQNSPVEIKYTVMDLYALRYYPFETKADSIIDRYCQLHGTNRNSLEKLLSAQEEGQHQKTSVQWVVNREFLDNQIQYSIESNDLIYKYLIKPYHPLLQFAAPLTEDSREIALTLGLQTDTKTEAIYGFLGKQNVSYLLDEVVEDALTFKGGNTYRYFLSGNKFLDHQPVYEVVFYPEKPQDNAFTGYLYISADGNYSLVKAVFTRNNPHNKNLLRDMVFTQTFEDRDGQTFSLKKKTAFTLGDDVRGSLLINRTVQSADIPEALTASEQQVENVVRIASQTHSFRNLQNILHLFLTDRLTLGGEKGLVEWGPVSQSVSYNEMEGLRLKAGGNTTLRLNNHFLLGGYLAYGLRDKQLKYRGEGIYSFLPKNKDIWEFPKRLLSASYIHDLNVPGHDLQAGSRDYFFYSFAHSGMQNRSLQKLFSIRYEHELKNRLSFRFGGRYLEETGITTMIPDITTSEMNVSLRYARGEIFMQNRDNRIYVRRGTIELNLNHRTGFKGLFGSDFRYHITDFSAYKRFFFPQDAGIADVQLSAGKVWNPVPFPLLFIPTGNQSYIYEENNYNLMNYYEFTTDRFVAGNLNFRFNWSPFSLFSKSPIKTTAGVKVLYGPLSDNNNPSLHPELFSFSPGIHPLGNDPYVEMHIGLANIFKLFRVEWVQRMTYSEHGSILISSGFTF
jgi:hypothetical protein